MTRVKICGLARERDVGAAVAAGADALGFVVDVDVDTPREISPARAADLADSVPPFVTRVLVTMADPADAAALAADVGADAVQFHGEPAPDDLAAFDRPALLAVDATDPGAVRRYDGVADALVLDSTDERGGGGTGRTHDWERAADLVAETASPVVLAGGLTAGNVADAVRTVEPFGVDVATGVEASGGRKDRAAVEAFVAEATGVRA